MGIATTTRCQLTLLENNDTKYFAIQGNITLATSTVQSTVPTFSIVVPTRDRPLQLATCLAAFPDLNYPTDHFDVIIVDDGSKAPLSEVAARFQKRLNIRLLTQSPSGPATARNFGASHSQAEYLAFIDDDCEPDVNWLKNIADMFRLSPDSGIGGKTNNALTDNLYSATSQLIIDRIYNYYNDDNSGSAKPLFFTSNNLAIPRKLFEQMGGFDKSFPIAAAEDREFCNRWIKQGNQFVYAPDATVKHSHWLSFRKFLRQHFNYGRGSFLFHRITKDSVQKRIRRGTLSLYQQLLQPPPPGTKNRLTITSLLLASQIATTAGYYREKIQIKKSSARGTILN